MRSNLKLFVIVLISAVFGAVVALRVDNSDAQPEGVNTIELRSYSHVSNKTGARFIATRS